MKKAWEIFRFEVSCLVRRPSTWLFAVAFLGITSTMVISFIETAREQETLFNAPLLVGATTVIAGMLSLLVVAALTADAATRDIRVRMEPLYYSSSIDKISYLGGRMLGAFAVGALLLALFMVALMFAIYLPGVEDELLGPFRPMAYLSAYAVVALPNLFVSTALLFSLSTLTRHALASYFGAAVLFIGGMFAHEVVAQAWGSWEWGKLLDPFGYTVLSEQWRAASPADKNTQLIKIPGSLLSNRGCWLLIALAVLALTLGRFRFRHHVPANWWRRKPRLKPELPVPEWSSAVAGVAVPGTFGRSTRWRQLFYLTGRFFLAMVKSPAALVIPLAAWLLVLIMPELLEGPLGVPSLPTTGRIVLAFQHFSLEMLVAVLIALCAGQLIWRERDARVNEMADAVPVPDRVWLLSKFLALVLVLVALQAGLMITGLLIQASEGYDRFEPGLYLRGLFGLQLVDYFLFAAAALTIHVLVNQKYVGHFVVFLLYLSTLFPAELGIEHRLLIYGADPGWSYSQMSGFGASLIPWLWFKLYWSGWALLLIILARLLWVRGREAGFQWRLRLARRRFPHPLLPAAGALLILAPGAFILYNTTVLNRHLSAYERAERRAEYERRYSRYHHSVQPQHTATSLHVDIYPDQREVLLQGKYQLCNHTGVAIDTIHLGTALEVETREVRFERPTRLAMADAELGHHIYVLESPLLPGDSLRLDFEVHYRPRGFPNQDIDNTVTRYATYFVHDDWLPAIGYEPDRELTNTGERRKHGLAPRQALRAPADATVRQDPAGRGHIRFEAVIGTAADQLAVAPGTLHRTWMQDGRRYFHYATERPIPNRLPFFSAKYAVHQARWREVELEVVHHPEHDHNLEQIMHAMQASLDYYTTEFGPYPHSRLRLVEYPGTGTRATAHPISMSFSEGFALLNPAADPRGFDLAFAVVAHEVAHQWWGNQLVPAYAEGAPLLTESLAWYSALGVVEKTHGPKHLGRLLDVMRESYLTPRSRADVPLLRASDPLSAYRKGPFAMYALREYVGEEAVNGALRRFLATHAAAGAPLPTSLDLYRELQAVTPDTLRPLLADLFEANTFWELETKAVELRPEAGGTKVTLDVKARKVQVDSAGKEKEMQMDDLIEIGVYAATEDGTANELQYLQLHRIRSGEQRITVWVNREPTMAGIDPRHLLIDTQWWDNSRRLEGGRED